MTMPHATSPVLTMVTDAVKLAPDWTLEVIWRFDCKTFVGYWSWDRRMDAWYVGLAAQTLACP